MNTRRRSLLILILGLLSALGPFSIDMYLPGFTRIAEDLGTTADYVSYSLSSFFIGVCIGQLICGPLIDRFGRKMPLIIGLLIYILASIGCAITGSIEGLIVFRFFQAIGGCVGMVAPRAIVRDVFPLNENAKIFSLLVLILGVSPIIAPTAGSFFITSFGWHSVFIALAVMAALLLIIVFFFLKESRPPDPTFSLKPKPILNSYISVVKEPHFYTYAFAGAVSSAGLFAYLSGSPFVFMELFSVNEQQYGWIFAIIAIGLITASQLNNILLRRFSSAEIIRVTFLIQAIIGILLVAGTAMNLLGLYGTIFLIFLFLSCQGFSFPNSSALSMAPFRKQAGSASALMGALQMGFGAIASALAGVLSNGTAIPMTGVMAGCAVIGLIILRLGSKRTAFNVLPDDVEEHSFEMIEKY